jgi:hypothetical protein
MCCDTQRLADLLDELHRDRLAVAGIRGAAFAAAEDHRGEGLATLIGLVEDRLKARCDELEEILDADEAEAEQEQLADEGPGVG